MNKRVRGRERESKRERGSKREREGGGGAEHLRLYALQIYHEISGDITDIRDIYRYLKVRFYENISSVFQICIDI